jgi:hypothetical protein
MLVVLAIVGLLAALLSAGAWRGLIYAKNAAIKVEISKLDTACQAFKEAFGDYPPDGYDANAVNLFIRRAFPDIDSSHFPTLRTFAAYDPSSSSMSSDPDPASYDPAGALVFWLGGVKERSATGNTWTGRRIGFSANPINPFDLPWDSTGLPINANFTSRIGPFYDFDSTRLFTPDTTKYKDAKARPQVQQYCPPGATIPAGATTPTPYVYYRAVNGVYGNGRFPQYISGTNSAPYYDNWAKVLFYDSSGSNPTWTPPNPYLQYGKWSGTSYQSGQWINPKTFQILCAGRDGKFGVGNDYPTGTSYDTNNFDDLSNFSQGTMEASMP